MMTQRNGIDGAREQMVRMGRVLLAGWLVFGASQAAADAGGPDFFRVIGVAADDVLNIRAEPDPHSAKVGEIPPGGSCIRNLGCRGGLTFEEFTTLDNARQAARLRENPRWCRIEYQGREGWVAGRFIAEGSCRQP